MKSLTTFITESTYKKPSEQDKKLTNMEAEISDAWWSFTFNHKHKYKPIVHYGLRELSEQEIVKKVEDILNDIAVKKYGYTIERAEDEEKQLNKYAEEKGGHMKGWARYYAFYIYDEDDYPVAECLLTTTKRDPDNYHIPADVAKDDGIHAFIRFFGDHDKTGKMKFISFIRKAKTYHYSYYEDDIYKKAGVEHKGKG